MKRSTNSAPLSLSTSYLIGSAFIGISMITLNSSGALAPGVTFCRLIGVLAGSGKPGFYDAQSACLETPQARRLPYLYRWKTPSRRRCLAIDHPVACPRPAGHDRQHDAGPIQTSNTASDEEGQPLITTTMALYIALACGLAAVIY